MRDRNDRMENPTYYEYSPFEDNDDRRDFVFKVYMILSIALGATSVPVFLFNYFDEAKEFCVDHRWLIIVFWLIFFVLYLAFVCCEPVRRQFPVNLIIFCLMIICLGLGSAMLSALFSIIVVLYAFLTTVAITVIVTFIAKFIPVDFTKCGTLLCIMSLIFVVTALILTILMFVLRMPILHVVIAGLGVIMVTFFMLYDTQRILGGKYDLDTDEYLLGAIQLYVDIMYLFQYLLQIFGYLIESD